jgi:hypothetical protein
MIARIVSLMAVLFASPGLCATSASMHMMESAVIMRYTLCSAALLSSAQWCGVIVLMIALIVSLGWPIMV